MKLILFFLTALLIDSHAYAFEAELKGFIALDLLKVNKQQREKQTTQTGIGVLDLKVYGRQDDFSMKIKLDIDGNLGERDNIFEEAIVSYRAFRNFKLTVGKGKIPFHQMHWGVIEASYIDGGSIIPTNHSIRDQDRKIMIKGELGGYRQGWIWEFAAYGDDDQVVRDPESGEPCYGTNSFCDTVPQFPLQTEKERVFSTKYERGFAQRVRFFPNRDWNLQAAHFWYYNQADPHVTHAYDLAARFRNYRWELWSEFQYGRYSKNAFARFSALKQYEYWGQLGAEYRYSSSMGFLFNTEALVVHQTDHFVTNDRFRTGITDITKTYKLEIGTKFYLGKSMFVTVGAMAEVQYVDISETDKATFLSASSFNRVFDRTDAYQLGSGFSYWF